MQESVKQDREWRKVEGFPNYSISNYGEVRNDKKNTLMGYSCDAKNYYRVALSKNNKRYARRVHRLVATAFIPNTEGKEQVNHKDGNKHNNFVGNLEWCTNQENQDHYWKCLDNGERRKNLSCGLKRAYRENPDLAKQKGVTMNKNREKIIQGIREKMTKKVIRVEDGKIFMSIADAERETGIGNSNIVAVCKGRKRIAGGYHWAYYKEA